jgi:hypothetical protein
VAKKNYKKKVARSRRVHRGGASASYSFGSASVSPATAPYATEVVAGSACQAATKFDAISGYVPPGRGGLPGYAGGGRKRSTRKRHPVNRFSEFSKRILKSLHFFKKSRKSKGRSRRSKMRGGAPYVVNVAGTTGGPNPIVPITKGTCEGGPVSTVQYSAPGVAQVGGVGGVDSQFLQMNESGYQNVKPNWVASTGVPGGGSLIQQPYAPYSMNPACVQSGAGRRKKRNSTARRCK